MSVIATKPRSAIQRGHTLMALRESNLVAAARLAGRIARPMRKRRRLNLESAIRRSLVGAKGIRP